MSTCSTPSVSPKCGGQVFGYFSGSFPGLTGQVERNGEGEIAELRLGRGLHDDILKLDSEEGVHLRRESLL